MSIFDFNDKKNTIYLYRKNLQYFLGKNLHMNYFIDVTTSMILLIWDFFIFVYFFIIVGLLIHVVYFMFIYRLIDCFVSKLRQLGFSFKSSIYTIIHVS